jgi:flagellar biosynthesis/type III secretory pathway chaperone
MNNHWEIIAESLRAELADYGALMNLFDQQQRSLFARDADSVLSLGLAIENQTRTLSDRRAHREQTVASFALRQGRPANSTLRSLLPLIEADARPLVEALMDEVNRLIHGLRRTSRHNHTLLARAVALHQETLQQLRPNAFTKTYSPAGRVSVASAETTSTLHVAG